MTRNRSFLLLALLALTFGLAVPSHASVVATPISLVRCGIFGAGAGETHAEALEMALDGVRANYYITSYTVTDSRCSEIDLTPWNPNDPTEPFCSVQISACGIPKPHLYLFP